MPKKARANCLVCGKEVGRSSSKFCSNLCQHTFDRARRYSLITESGNVWPHIKKPEAIKDYLASVRGRCCEICKLTEWQSQPIPLVLDHVDGNSSNWLVSNLRLVCGNCDMQLPTYKGRNKGKGRHNRRQRYANGQSY